MADIVISGGSGTYQNLKMGRSFSFDQGHTTVGSDSEEGQNNGIIRNSASQSNSKTKKDENGEKKAKTVLN